MNAYNELLEKYTTVLDLAKQNADANEYRIQELENKLEYVQNALDLLAETYPECEPMCIEILKTLSNTTEA